MTCHSNIRPRNSKGQFAARKPMRGQAPRSAMLDIPEEDPTWFELACVYSVCGALGVGFVYGFVGAVAAVARCFGIGA